MPVSWLENLFSVLIVLWFASEVALGVASRRASFSAVVTERGSVAVIWTVLTVSAFSALASQYLGVARLPLSRSAALLLAEGSILLGLVIRWLAISTLGRFFTVDVAIQRGHEIVDRGPYRWIRHPAYAGILVSFLGLGFAFGNWLALALATVPPTAVILRRIRVEEAALLQEFGARYRRYCERTKRLVPGLY